MTSHLQYSSPFRNQRFAVTGRFSKLSNKQIQVALARVDAQLVEARGNWVNDADVLIAGSHAGRALAVAEAAGLTLWSEAELLTHLAAYDEAVTARYAVPNIEPAIDCFLGTRIARMLGLPKRKVARSPIDGELYAYQVAIGRLEKFVKEQNLSSLQALAIDGYQNSEAYDNDLLRLFTEKADQLGRLRALAFPRSWKVYGEPLLTALPNLECLLIGSQSAIDLDMVRHSDLRQLSLLNVIDDTLLRCSLPALRFLELGINRGSWGDDKKYAEVAHTTVVASIQNKQFMQLEHLWLNQLFNPERSIKAALQDAKSLPNLRSIAIHENTFDASTDSVMQALAASPIAQQLTHLTFGNCAIKDPALWQQLLDCKHFPELQSIDFQDGSIDNEHTIHATRYLDWDSAFPNGIHLGFSHSSLDAALVRDLIGFLRPCKHIRSLNIDHHFVDDAEVLQALHALPFPISSWRTNYLLESI